MKSEHIFVSAVVLIALFLIWKQITKLQSKLDAVQPETSVRNVQPENESE
jgi:hypothetical protein